MGCEEALSGAERVWKIGTYRGKEVYYAVKQGEDPRSHKKIDCGDRIVIVRGPMAQR